MPPQPAVPQVPSQPVAPQVPPQSEAPTQPEVPAQSVDAKGPVTQKPKLSKPIKILAALAVIALLTGAAYWFLNRNDEDDMIESGVVNSDYISEADPQEGDESTVGSDTGEEQKAEMKFDDPTESYSFNVSFMVPGGNINVLEPEDDDYPSLSYVEGDTYYIKVTHPYESFPRQFTDIEKKNIQNENHTLGDIYFVPIDLDSTEINTDPPINSGTHVGYSVVNEVSLDDECGGDEQIASIDAPCGFVGLLGDWSDDDEVWPFITFSCFFEIGEEDLELCERAVETLKVVQGEK